MLHTNWHKKLIKAPAYNFFDYWGNLIFAQKETEPAIKKGLLQAGWTGSYAAKVAFCCVALLCDTFFSCIKQSRLPPVSIQKLYCKARFNEISTFKRNFFSLFHIYCEKFSDQRLLTLKALHYKTVHTFSDAQKNVFTFSASIDNFFAHPRTLSVAKENLGIVWLIIFEDSICWSDINNNWIKCRLYRQCVTLS